MPIMLFADEETTLGRIVGTVGGMSGFGAMYWMSEKVAPRRAAQEHPEIQVALDEFAKLEQTDGINLIRDQVTAMLRDARTVVSIREEGMAPRDLVLLVISNIAGAELSSGRYHAYRGMLAVSGQRLRKAFTFAVAGLEKSGFHSAAESTKDYDWLAEQIKQVG